ncbi:MAG: NAD(P)/FAD-dependent oxidoreductase [Anaerolineales bacterium]
MTNIIVIGGGPAGVTAALRASELGANVTLVERDRLGGICTNDGCVPTRVLAKAARLAREVHHFEDYGLVGEPPQVDFAQLIKRTQQVVYQTHQKKQLIKHLKSANVNVITEAGEASFADPHTISLQDGRKLQADKFIVCVGGHARRINFPGAEHALTHHDVWSMKKLPKSVAIIGAAATGCQLASIFNAFGSQVYILDLSPRVLPIEDAHTSETMGKAFQGHGIEVLTGIGGVEGIEKNEDNFVLRYKHQDQVHSIESEAILLAVGWVGNVESLNLAAAGVETQRSYVVVNDYLQSNVEHIFAAGDITGKMMLVQSGSHEGRVAAENAVLGLGQPQRHTIVPHGGFTDPEYASVGLTEEAARSLEEEIAVGIVSYADLDRAVIDGHTEGFCKLIVSRDSHRLLGAHVVGEQALEVIQLVAAGMAAEIWIEQLAELELAYPTYSASVGLAARRLVHDLGVMPLAPQWRALAKPPAAEWERSENT